MGSSLNLGSAKNTGTTIISPGVSLNAGDYLVSFKVRSNIFGSDVTIPGIGLSSGSNNVTLVSNLTIAAGNIFTNASDIGSIVNAGTYNIQFTGLQTNSIIVDSFSIVAVPEPATMVLLGSLCSAVAGYKYKRKQSV